MAKAKARRARDAGAPTENSSSPYLSASGSVWLLLLILLPGLWLRFHNLDSVPPGLYPDEAINGIDALRALGDGGFQVFYRDNFGREGLMVALQAVSIAIAGVSAFALRLPSAVVGTLTVLLTLFAVRKALTFFGARAGTPPTSDQSIVALLTALFIATSFWHLNFSRIAFRGILDPCLGLAALCLLMVALERNSTRSMLLAGLATGVGLYAYPSYRFLVLPMIFIVVFDGWRRHGGFTLAVAGQLRNSRLWVFLGTVSLLALPLIQIALVEPDTFFRRARMLSVTAADEPLSELLLSARAVALMFFSKGDTNWRHNLSGQPALPAVLMVFFALGLLLLVVRLVAQARPLRQSPVSRWLTARIPLAFAGFLLLWLVATLLPGILAPDARPHFLRTISAIPPTYTIAAIGAVVLFGSLVSRLPRGWAATSAMFASLVLGGFLVRTVYQEYFNAWANDVRTRQAFSAGVTSAANEINLLPAGVAIYVVLERPHASASLQRWAVAPITFLTRTENEAALQARRIHYVPASEVGELPPISGQPAFFLINARGEEGWDLEQEVRRIAPGALIIK